MSRLIDRDLDELLPGLPAIALDGPKGVGKTETSARRAGSVVRLDDPDVALIARPDPTLVIKGPRPVLLDEWQHVPAVWDAVRRAVDAGAGSGSFLLTGSASPAAHGPVHSAAGRIASLRMRPMIVSERSGAASPTVSLSDMIEGRAELGGESQLRLTDYVEEIVASGFPAIRGLPPRARRVQLDGYLTRLFERDLPEATGVTARRPASLRAWLSAYAAATSTTASLEAIRAAATPGAADPPSKVTTLRYRDWLTSMWLLDPVPAWRPPGAPLRRLIAAPKHHVADPALAARLLGVGARDLRDGQGRTILGQGPLLGALFESLCAMSVRVIAQSLDARVSHLRTQRGEREVDLIVEGDGGRVVGIEVKLTATVDAADVKNLHWLRSELGAQVRDLVVLTTGSQAYRRADGVAVVPLALLGP
nr:DUF4143 domain-containing protein [Kineosphaera limosa]